MSDAVRTVWHEISGPLHAEATDGDPRRRIVFVHGFTQTANSWKPIAEEFAARGHQCIVVDLPGHGDSANVRADLRRTADMLAAIGGDATYVGYSLGGRVCLHLALMYPHHAERLVLIGAHPGIDDDDERAARREHDDEVAARIHEQGVALFLREWSAQPLFGGFVLGEAEFADRLRNTPDGLANSLQMAGTGTQTSLWPRLREITMPMLVIAGESDEKFVAIGRQLAAAAPRGQFMALPGAAHAAHLQQPAAMVTALSAFLRLPAGI